MARGASALPRGRWWQVGRVRRGGAGTSTGDQPWDRPYELARTLLNALAPQDALPVALIRRVRAVPARPKPPVWPVLPLPDATALAALAEVAPTELQWYADLRGLQRRVRDERLRHYRYCWRPSPHRPARLIEAPKDRLKLIQRRILRDVLSVVPVSPIAHGYVPGGRRSPRLTSMSGPRCWSRSTWRRSSRPSASGGCGPSSSLSVIRLRSLGIWLGSADDRHSPVGAAVTSHA